MKLTKRIALIYSIGLFGTIIICAGFFIGFTNGSKTGERLRAAEISLGVNGNLKHLLDKQSENLYLYKKIVESSFYSNTMKENLSISNNQYDFTDSYLLINSKNPSKDFLSIENNNSKNTIDLQKEILNKLATLSKEKFSSLLTINNETFIINYETINLEPYDYILSITNFDEEVFNYISNSTNSKINIIYDIHFLTSKIYKKNVYDKEYLFSETKDNIHTYLPLDISYSPKNVYLEIIQPKNVEATVTSNFLIYMTLMILVFFLINFILYKLIKKTIIKRILLLNQSVKNSTENNLTLTLNSSVNYQDEIADLSKEISDMFTRLTVSSELIKNNELKNSEILRTMTNGFIYCKAIFNEDKEIIDGEILEINSAAKTFLDLQDSYDNFLSKIKSSFITDEFIENLNNAMDNKEISSTHELQLTNGKWVTKLLQQI